MKTLSLIFLSFYSCAFAIEPLKFAWPQASLGHVTETATERSKTTVFEYQVSANESGADYEIELSRARVTKGESLDVLVGSRVLSLKIENSGDPGYKNSLEAFLIMLGKEASLTAASSGNSIRYKNLSNVNQTIESFILGTTQDKVVARSEIERVRLPSAQAVITGRPQAMWMALVARWVGFVADVGEPLHEKVPMNLFGGSFDANSTIENLGAVEGHPDLVHLRITDVVSDERFSRAALSHTASSDISNVADIQVMVKSEYEVQTNPKSLRPAYAKMTRSMNFRSKSGKPLPVGLNDQFNSTEYRIAW